MCGIVGAWHEVAAGRVTEATIRAMTGTLRHRGPDDVGFWQDPDTGLSLGHTRLSIIDVSSEGHQPMVSASGRFVLVFNGEVYNFRDLRGELEATGATFRGHSDTTVVLAAFERWGIAEAVRRFAGMFALAVFDREKRELHLARDRVGEKPLYHGWSNGCLLFASELKALRLHPSWRGEINREALTLFLRHNYIPAPYSIYAGIHKLPPATLATYSLDGSSRDPVMTGYWSARGAVEAGLCDPWPTDEGLVLGELDALLRETVKREMVADVPLGAFLSGGIDSSLIVALMQEESDRPVRTFTIGFHEEGFNEAEYAGAVAQHLGTDHTELYVTAAEARDVIPSLPDLYDEPFADSSQIPTHLVSRLASEHVKVSLSGDGGDELFGGYRRYSSGRRAWSAFRYLPGPLRRSVARKVVRVAPRQWDALLRFLPRRVLGHRVTGERIRRLAGLLSANQPTDMYRDLVSYWQDPAAVVLGGAERPTRFTQMDDQPDGASFVEWMMYMDLVTYLPDDILVKVDRASMGVSLESRAPFLDHRVVEFAWRVPLALKVRDGEGKWVLKRLLDRYVPKHLVDRPKAGFGVPIGQWLRGSLREWAAELLDPSRLEAEGFLRSGPIRRRWSEHQDGSCNWEYSLWGLLMFQAWREAQSVPASTVAR